MQIKNISKLLIAPPYKNTIKLATILAVVMVVFNTTLDVLGLQSSGREVDLSVGWSVLILAVIIAPIIETFIYQLLVITIAKSWKLSDKISVSISALVFSYVHFINTKISIYMFIEMLPFAGFGYVLGWVYLINKQRAGIRGGFVSTALLHALYNGILFTIASGLLWLAEMI
ncbi:CPBP family intramembrane glutamic endopeptidase [Kordiimonas laminariae]|uniref:CPBP family intramembrane glutamic endopeptidase n=1 Tax=Kordiimonas laminariae TaxID=2917717 RepID=UPI001FF16D2E|nr:CPBP family intramembrane glutamic endopeptidase [Kordiimonas laminariae]MCK0070529.1 CPBP family intramembrane metalloprotease [Kordiimonas laminariae]